MDSPFLPLVTYECGCIGLAPGPQGRILVLVNPDDWDARLGWRDDTESHRGKQFVWTDHAVAVRYTQELNKLISDGYDMQAVRAALKERTP